MHLMVLQKWKIFYCSLDLVEQTLSKNVKTARQILRVLHEVMIGYIWEEMDEEILARLLSTYYHSIHPSPDDEYCFSPVRKGLELVIRALFESFSNANLLKSVSFSISATLKL